MFKLELNTINIMSISYTGIFSVDLLEYITWRHVAVIVPVPYTAAVYNHRT